MLKGIKPLKKGKQTNDTEWPIKFKDISRFEKKFDGEILLARGRAIESLSNGPKKHVDFQVLIEVLVEYAGLLLHNMQRSQEPKEYYAQEFTICLLNAAHYFQNISLNMFQSAYTNDSSDFLWSASGNYLRKGLGLIHFTQSELKVRHDDFMFKKLSEMNQEFKLIQELGILTLSFTKLKAKMSNNDTNELDLQTNDLKEASSLSLFYAKLCVGCRDTTLQLSKGTITNKALLRYLDGVIFLLVSMDQFRNNQCGVAIGMLEEAINSLSNIVPRSKLTSTVLSTPKLKLSKKMNLKNTLQSTVLKSKIITTNNWSIASQNNVLLPLLDETLDTFIIPLITLLRYVYSKTNDQLFFQTVVTDKPQLLRLLPGGRSPQLESIQWTYDNGKIKELPVSNSSPVRKNYF